MKYGMLLGTISSIDFHGYERLFVVAGGRMSIYLGYRLYIFGINTGFSKVDY